MTCIFVVLYFFYITLVETKFVNLKSYWIQIKFKFWNFVHYSIFAGLMSMFVLIPAIVGMLKTGKTNNSIATFLPYPHFLTDIFQQLGIDNSNYLTRLSHLPSFYVGSLVILLVALYFQLPFRKKEKCFTALFLGLIFISFWIQTANAVWHMFQQVAGFPYRNSFMLSFLLIIIAYQVWQQRLKISPWILLRTILMMIVLFTVGYMTGLLAGVHINNIKIIFSGQWNFYIYAVFLLLINGLVLWKFKGKFLLSLLILDMSFSFYKDLSVIPGNSSKSFLKEYEAVTKLADSVKSSKPESPFYRTDSQLHFYNVGYNQSLQSSYYGVASYSSTLNNQLRLTQKALGQASRNERRISSVGLTDFSSYLLDVNYEIINSESTNINSIINGEKYLGKLQI
ncbi:YfhO family protein [Lactovum miscens]|uniref:YfhO family protein n=1 Tax=Lactovum miscens TaxID=190387 RepID=UPI0016195FD5|nr:YfhO family protein [Lactovum miscens]